MIIQKQTGANGPMAISELYRDGKKVLADASNQRCWMWAMQNGDLKEVYREEWIGGKTAETTCEELIASAAGLHGSVRNALEAWGDAPGVEIPIVGEGPKIPGYGGI